MTGKRFDLSPLSTPLTGLYGCIRCGQGFKRYEDLEKHLSTVHKDAKAEDDLRSLNALKGEMVTDYDPNEVAKREPQPAVSDFNLLEHLDDNPLPKHLFKGN